MDQEKLKKKASQMPNSFLYFQKRFGARQWSIIGPGSEKKLYSISEDSPQGEWENMAEKDDVGSRRKRTFNFPCYESRSRLKSKGHGKLSIHYCADLETIETIFRIIVSANQLSLYGAVAEMCEEYETLHDRSAQHVVGKQSSSSLVLSVIKTEVLLDCDDLAHKDLLLQQYGERIEKLSQQDKLSKFCMDAGFLTTVEVGQYFMTKDTAELSQFTDSVACCEYTMPRDTRKLDSREHQKLDLYWKLQPVARKLNMELRPELCP